MHRRHRRAHAPDAVMLAYRRSATLLKRALDAVVVADACPPAYFAQTQAHTLLARLCSHITDPPHSLHALLTRLWWQMLEPPHILHTLLMRSCSHICDLSHSLHVLLTRLWWQCWSPCISCTHSLISYARISAIPHTPCSGSCDGCGGRCLRPRNPCTEFDGDCGGILHRLPWHVLRHCFTDY